MHKLEISKEKFSIRYKRVEDLLAEYDVPHRDACLKILKDNRKRSETAPGSRHNHQAWPGGYIDHIHEVMNWAVIFYHSIQSTGRLMSFTLGQALLVLIHHDLEKLWAYYFDGEGNLVKNPDLMDKEKRRIFRDKELARYGISLNEMEANAFRYVEGELNDYDPNKRVMNELAAFCHMCDVWSARGNWNYPLEQNDSWQGAQRFRTEVSL